MTKPMHIALHPLPLVAVLALAAPAQGADDPHPPAAAPMSGMSAMSEGDRFDKADADHDGILSISEFQALKQPRPEMRAMPMGSLADKRIRDLIGVELVNRDGARIGKVGKVLVHQQDRRLHAIVSVGGFLGIGDKEIALPLTELSWQAGRLQAATMASKAEFKERQRYDPLAYGAIVVDQTVAEAGGMMGSREPTFEAVDSNQDQRIDRAEFSAFESGEPMHMAPEGSSAPPSRSYKPSY